MLAKRRQTRSDETRSLDQRPSDEPVTALIAIEAPRQEVERLLDGFDGRAVVVAHPAPPPQTESSSAVSAPPPLEFGDLEVDLDDHRARWKGMTLQLTETEIRILAALAKRPARAVTFDALFEKAWDTTYYGDVAPVHAAIKRLRKKLRRARVALLIESIRGVGFRLRRSVPSDDQPEADENL